MAGNAGVTGNITIFQIVDISSSLVHFLLFKICKGQEVDYLLPGEEKYREKSDKDMQGLLV